MKKHLREAVDFARKSGAAAVNIDFAGSGHVRLILETADGRRRTVIASSTPSRSGAIFHLRRAIAAALCGAIGNAD